MRRAAHARRMPARDDRGSLRHYEGARDEGHGPATTTDARSLIPEQATISHDGWARWAEDGPVIVGDGQAERGCDTPEVSQG
jgi:hypothetical protein